METARYLDLFVSESREHVSAINRHLLAMEEGKGGRKPVEAIFRAVHTLKGMAAAMGFSRSASLAHAMEHLLEQLRSGALGIDQEVLDALFQGVDELESAMDRELSGEAEAAEPDPAAGADPALANESGGVAPSAVGVLDESGLEGPGSTVKVTLMVSASTPLPAVRAVLALKRARDLGTVGSVEPDEARLNAGDFKGTLVFLMRSERDPEEIREALLAAGDIAHVLVEELSDVEGPGGGGAAVRGDGAVVRVNQARLDELVDRVGELVIARGALERLMLLRDADEELQESVQAISRLVAELRDDVMSLRMVPVGEAFDRFPRLVRDAARSLGKRVVFSVAGRDVELDRSLLHELGDLLVHLLRNAVDHGIESPEERESQGKPPAGEVRLRAWREGSGVVVSVADDGRGIQRDLVTRAAVRLGLLTEEQAASIPDDELFSFLARPGFSTAARITDVSGRGVGLDVVSTRLRALGGAMEVHAESGAGTVFTVKLPLSLAIARCLQVEIAGEPYLIPLQTIAEVTEVLESEIIGDEQGERVVVREETIPLLRLVSLLSPDEPTGGFGPHPVVIVETAAGVRALMVDTLVGQHESVLKPFDAAAEMLPLFSGAALLSDGRPSLVLDVNRVATWAADQARQGETKPTAETLC
jgi:two-component system chemotaxis sensor kinase CheA